MKLKRILTALLLAFVCAFVAQADTTTFKGQPIWYTGTVNVTGEDSTYRLFKFTSGTGTIVLPSDVTADILAVGGGGGGGGGRRSGSNTYTGGSGGDGGGVDERKGVSLSAQTLSISVGDGGAGGSYSTSSNQAGSQGSESKVYNGSTNYAKADGGAGGAGGNASNDGQGASGQTGTDKRDGKSSEVSGTLMTYGAGGQKANHSSTTRSARTTNTGNGGNGATKPGGSNSQHYVGQGGDSGVVIVKITDIDEPKPVASLISGTIPVGAYDVEILNASRTNWVDGELVITYLNTDAFVAKSFTLPKQTTGQLLAVGGGGAGGQDSSYSKDSGLPGGGGAGGLVFSGDQAFSAAKYWVTVGAGGVAPRGTMNRHAGANGEDSTVTCAGETFANALGGGGGGVQTVVGQAGGCGGGGSYSGTAAGSSIQESDAKMGVGFPGGAGNNAKFGGGGGGAGGAGKPTSSADSGAGGPGLELDITGTNVVYARGGAGGVPRLNNYYYYDGEYGIGVRHLSGDKTVSGKDVYLFEAEDGKPGRNGYGDGGGGGGHYGLGGKNDTAATYAGSGGNGVVIVRIPPYSISVEDALKRAFAGQSVTVSGSQVTLTGDVSGPIGLPDNIGAVTIDLAGHAIAGADGAAGEPVDITPGGDGEPAIRLVPHVYTCEAGRTQVKIRGSGGLVGGNGGNGYPGGRGSAAVARAAGVGTDVTVDTGAASQTSGADGETYVQHAHVWTYKQVGNEIHATCVATDGEQCSYKKPEHALKIVLHADDVEFTGARYDSAGVDNGILPVVGIPTGIVFYEGREDKGTVYPKSATPPTDAGYYLATLTFNGMTMEKDFSIIEGKMQQDTVYQSTKTAVRSGSDVLITLRASYDGAKAINYGNVLFLGSRCSAHSMKTAALAGTINALTPFANVQWYAYGSTDPTENKSGYTAKGQQVQESEFTLVGANHFVYDRMMDDLYAELVENRNNRAYDMVILEFDGDLLGRNHLSPYQLTYTLPDGWTDEKAAILRTAMSAFYDANRVVWVVPNVDADKDDYGYTGVYPWMSKPEFVWQRALLNATEDAGYCCPLQKNYEDADELVSFMQQALIGAYFKKVKITDTIADGLSFSKDDVATEFRDVDGLWKNACPSAVESRYGTTITATKTINGRTVAVEFDTSAFQAEALRREALVNNDVRVTIRARIEDEFFSGLGGGAPKDTNVGDATFVYSGGEDVGDFTNNVPPASIPNVKPDPIYETKDYVGYYDAEGHTITVTVIDPDPAVKTPDIRYSLEKDGSYDKDLLLTNVCEMVDVWFTLTAEGYATVTNYAKVTIRPRVVELTAEDATKPYDGNPLTTNGFTVASVTPDDYAQGKGFVPGEGIDKVTMTDDSQQTEVGNHPNVVNPDKSTMIPKTGTDLDNYIVIIHPGTLTVTPPLPMGIEAFDAEKFYDAEPTNITYVVTNAAGVAITPDTISLREKGTDSWIPAADFTLYVDTTNVTVEVRAEKLGFDPVTAEATVVINPRPVTLIAASDSKVYDGQPLTNWTFTVKEDTATEGYGFVKDEGVASVTMTPESTITLPGSQPNEIATSVAKEGTKLERNYVVSTEPGTLTVTAASMGIEAFDAEKFYDADPTNIAWVVTNAAGVAITDATISLREQGSDTWIPVAEFAPFVDTTNVIVEVKAEKSGFDPVTAEATVVINPRPVTLIAASDSKSYDGLPLTNWTFTVKEDTATEGYGFVKDEGVASVTMTPESTITLPGSQPNEIATSVAKEGTKLDRNYIVDTVDGTLTVTAASMGIEAFPAEKFYDAEGTNITWAVTNATGGVISDATISLREKGTDTWIPAADFVPYVDTTNVIVEVKAEKSGFDPVTAEATVVINPRPVTLIAASDSKSYDGLPLTNWTFTVKEDTATEGYGFVKEEGVASVTMTPESTITLPGSQPNEIATSVAKEGTKLERNYVVSTEPGTLTVTAASMGIEAFDAEKFYDAEGTNITWAVTNAQGGVISDAAIFLREQGATEWITAADFVLYVDTTNVIVEVRAQKTGFGECFAEATVVINPRPVTLIAASDSKVYDGLPLTNWTFTVKEDTATEGYGFVKDEGVASVTMTPESTITLPGSQPNEIATSVAKEGTKLERNYVVSTEKGTLTVTPAAFTASATPYDEFYDGQEHTIEVEVQKPEDAGEATITYAYAEGGTYLPIEDFEQLKDVTAGGPVTVYAKVEVEGYSTVVVSATVNIKPRIVVEQAESASKIFDGTPLVQPNHHEETDVEAEKSKEKWGTDEVLANSTGFVAGEGFAGVPMTAGSAIIEPGAADNVIDAAGVTLLEGTKTDNYIFYYLPGELTVIQRQEEVRRDPEVEIPEESKEVIEEADKKVNEVLDEMAKADQEESGEVYVKYQLTVTPTNHLDETTRTTPEKAAEDAKEQIELAESKTGSKIDKVEFVDIVLERTYSKEEAEATAAGDYNKDNWEPLDKAEEHGNTLFEVVIPVEIPEGMELIGVTRSCDSKGTEILKPKDPNDPNAEGFVYDPATKTVTLYAYDFCVFGFMMKKKGLPFNNLCERPLVYDFRASVRHMFLKEVKVSVKGGFRGTVYGKIQKSASLKGYLIVDRAGATSQTVVKGRGTDCNNIPASGMDYGRNRAFLVVLNSSAEKAVRKPKVLPAVLDAKWMDTAFACAHAASSGLAEGYLHVGGDSIACARPQLDQFGVVVVERAAVPQPPSAGTPGMAMLADYAWTSVYLFGQYNGPSWYTDGALSQSEQAINAAQPPDLQICENGVPIAPHPFYHDTWMDCAGIGKYFVPSVKEENTCCGVSPSMSCGALPAEPTLSSLSGTLKGGLFLCSENGIVATGSDYVTFDGGVWEDQFATARLVPAGTFAPDAFQTDLWQDGAIAQETTDVLCGSWSIKIRQNFIPDAQIADQGTKALLTNAEMDALAYGANAPVANHVEAATGLYMLVGTLKAAVLKLDKTATFVETKATNKEIYSKPANARLAVPAITPKFAQYFGLANWW